MQKLDTMIVGFSLAVLCASSVHAQGSFDVIVKGNTMSWGDETYGYIQVQDAENYETFCEMQVQTLNDTPEGSRENEICFLTPGRYQVINHTFGQRILNVSISDNIESNRETLYSAPQITVVDGKPVKFNPSVNIQSDTIIDLGMPPKPENLSVDIYSASALELFWERASVSGLVYDIRLDDELIGTTNGISFFLNQLQTRETYTLSVVARDKQGAQSSLSQLEVEMPDDGNSGRTISQLVEPTGLRSEVYAINSMELFWDRQGPGQVFEVYDQDGDVITSTTGTSFFYSPDVSSSTDYTFSVAAVDPDTNATSTSATIVFSTGGLENPVINTRNAEALLAKIVSIANGGLFSNVESIMDSSGRAVESAGFEFSSSGTTSNNEFTLVDNSGEDTNGDGVIDGNQYICNAGGAAASLSLENSSTGGLGFNIGWRLDDCRLNTSVVTGAVRYFNSTIEEFSQKDSYTGVLLQLDDSPVDFSIGSATSSSGFGDLRLGEYLRTSSIDDYSEIFSDTGVVSLRITNYTSSTADRDPGIFGIFEEPAEPSADADISFTVEFANSSDDELGFPYGTYTALIDLAYSGDDRGIEPADRWNAGSITVTAKADGSQLLSQLIDTDGNSTFESMELNTIEGSLIRPIEEGYLVVERR